MFASAGIAVPPSVRPVTSLPDHAPAGAVEIFIDPSSENVGSVRMLSSMIEPVLRPPGFLLPGG